MSSTIPKHIKKWWIDPWLKGDKGIEQLSSERPKIVVLGSGAGGAFAACTLAEAGVDVVVVEKGFHYAYYNAPKNLAVAVSELYEEGGFRTAMGAPPCPVAGGKGLGGSTLVNSAICFKVSSGINSSFKCHSCA